MNNQKAKLLARFPYLRNSLVRACMLVLCALVFVGCTAYRAERLKNKSYREWKAYQWNLEKQYEINGQAWTSYSRKIEGSKYKEFKIEGEISVSAAMAVEVLREKAENGLDNPEREEAYVEVLRSNEQEAIIYSVYNMPFPFKDRAMCERFSFTVVETTGIHKISWAEDWDMAPERNEKVIRMPIARGSWEFEPIGNKSSMATYIVHADPGGSIPPWIVNSTVRKGLPRELRNIEALVQTRKEYSPPFQVTIIEK